MDSWWLGEGEKELGRRRWGSGGRKWKESSEGAESWREGIVKEEEIIRDEEMAYIRLDLWENYSLVLGFTKVGIWASLMHRIETR